MSNFIAQDWIIFRRYGAAFRITITGELECVPVNTDGSLDYENVSEVSVMEHQGLLRTINAVFGTAYTMKHFSGR